jgi:ferrous iron transport protein A
LAIVGLKIMSLTLSQLKRSQTAIITRVVSTSGAGQDVALNQPKDAMGDPIARRLVTLGFVPGEQVKVLALGLFGADPMMVQIGFTRFALRKAEAARIEVREVEAA